jgi:hypothetical protein
MRIVTPPNCRVIMGLSYTGTQHQQVAVLSPRKQLFRCPKCNGAVKEEVDDKFLVLTCINCGWDKCNISPDMKHYGEDKVDYEKRY